MAERKVSLNIQDVEEVKERLRRMNEMNQELRMQNRELEVQRDNLKKQLDEALAMVYKSTIDKLENENNLHLKPISSENAMTILFTDGFKQLAYLKESDLNYVNEQNRRWAYDNASQFKWFIWKKDVEESMEQDSLFEDEEEKKSFKDTFHEVRLQDLPAYLKIFRYEEVLGTEHNGVVSQTQWAKYERGQGEPSDKTIALLENHLNIRISKKSNVKTIRIHDFGERLKELSYRKELTLAELGRQAGLNDGVIMNYSSRDVMPLPNNNILPKIAEILDVSICYLLTGTNEWER